MGEEAGFLVSSREPTKGVCHLPLSAVGVGLDPRTLGEGRLLTTEPPRCFEFFNIFKTVNAHHDSSNMFKEIFTQDYQVLTNVLIYIFIE